MAETVADIEARLVVVRAQIAAAGALQGYSIAGRSVQRGGLSQLMKLERQLEFKLARTQGGGMALISDHSRETGAI